MRLMPLDAPTGMLNFERTHVNRGTVPPEFTQSCDFQEVAARVSPVATVSHCSDDLGPSSNMLMRLCLQLGLG